MFCRLKLGPQDFLLSQVFLQSSTRCHFKEKWRGGGGRGVGVGGMFFLRFGRCYGESHILLIQRFLTFYCSNADYLVRFFQDRIPNCLKVTILRFKKVTVAPFLSMSRRAQTVGEGRVTPRILEKPLEQLGARSEMPKICWAQITVQ